MSAPSPRRILSPVAARGRRWVGAVAIAALALATPVTGAAHPGSTERWDVTSATAGIHVGRAEVRYEPGLEAVAASVAANLPAFWEQIEHELGQDVDDAITVYLVSHAGEVHEASGMPDWATGVANGPRGEVIVAMHSPDGAQVDVGKVVRHELAHVALHRATNFARMPRWFNEGVADVLGAGVDLGRSRDMAMAYFGPGVTSIHAVERDFWGEPARVSAAYAASRDFVLWLRARDDGAFRQVIARLRGGHDFSAAITGAYGASLDSLDAEWRGGMFGRMSWAPLFESGALPLGLTFPLFFVAWSRRRRTMKEAWERLEREDERERAVWPVIA